MNDMLYIACNAHVCAIDARTGAKDDLPALQSALADEDVFVRRAAAGAITRVTGDTITAEPRVPPDASYPADFGLPRGTESATIVTDCRLVWYVAADAATGYSPAGTPSTR